MSYTISGRRQNGEVLYLWQAPSGLHFVPNGYSRAVHYCTKAEAKIVLEQLQSKFKGLRLSVGKLEVQS